MDEQQITIRATCQSCGMIRHIHLSGMDREIAGAYARLLDGTSKLYVEPPPEDCCIGMCWMCVGGRIRCEVLDEPPKVISGRSTGSQQPS